MNARALVVIVVAGTSITPTAANHHLASPESVGFSSAGLKVKTAGGEVPQATPMTMRQLMSHTAGFDVNAGYAKLNLPKRDQPLQSFINSLAKLPLTAQPGTDWQYGPSVDIQGYLVEK